MGTDLNSALNAKWYLLRVHGCRPGVVFRAARDRPHGLKYRFYRGRRGICVVRYDNETGKGDHRHVGHREEPHAFTSVEALIEVFRRDCKSLANWSWE